MDQIDLTDAAYTAIGFGILGFQRLQVARRRLRRRLEREGRFGGTADTDLTALFERLDRGLDELGAVLPELAVRLLDPLLGDTRPEPTDPPDASAAPDRPATRNGSEASEGSKPPAEPHH
ncbi:MAG TPA: hypothetical protein ENI86_16735 [Acidimicrobiales bacterium]|nr:hypothetical protein [Acidimicrobiales bacterium]